MFGKTTPPQTNLSRSRTVAMGNLVGPMLKGLSNPRANLVIVALASGAFNSVDEGESKSTLRSGGLHPSTYLSGVVRTPFPIIKVAVPLNPTVRMSRLNPPLLFPEAKRRANSHAVFVNLWVVLIPWSGEVVVGYAGPPCARVRFVLVLVRLLGNARTNRPPVRATEATGFEDFSRGHVRSKLRIVTKRNLAVAHPLWLGRLPPSTFGFCGRRL